MFLSQVAETKRHCQRWWRKRWGHKWTIDYSQRKGRVGNTEVRPFQVLSLGAEEGIPDFSTESRLSGSAFQHFCSDTTPWSQSTSCRWGAQPIFSTRPNRLCRLFLQSGHPGDLSHPKADVHREWHEPSFWRHRSCSWPVVASELPSQDKLTAGSAYLVTFHGLPH